MFFVGQPWWPTFLKTLSHLQKFPSYAPDINLDIFHYEYIVSILNKKLPPLKIEKCWAILFYCNTANLLASRPPRRKVDCKITQTKKLYFSRKYWSLSLYSWEYFLSDFNFQSCDFSIIQLNIKMYFLRFRFFCKSSYFRLVFPFKPSEKVRKSKILQHFPRVNKGILVCNELNGNFVQTTFRCFRNLVVTLGSRN